MDKATFEFYLPGRQPSDYASEIDALSAIWRDLVALHGKQRAKDMATVFLSKMLADFARREANAK